MICDSRRNERVLSSFAGWEVDNESMAGESKSSLGSLIGCRVILSTTFGKVGCPITINAFTSLCTVHYPELFFIWCLSRDQGHQRCPFWTLEPAALEVILPAAESRGRDLCVWQSCRPCSAEKTFRKSKTYPSVPQRELHPGVKYRVLSLPYVKRCTL